MSVPALKTLVFLFKGVSDIRSRDITVPLDVRAFHLFVSSAACFGDYTYFLGHSTRANPRICILISPRFA